MAGDSPTRRSLFTERNNRARDARRHQRSSLIGEGDPTTGAVLSAGKYRKRMAALMSRPTPSKQKESTKTLQKKLGVDESVTYTGKPISPSQRMAARIRQMMQEFKKRQKQLLNEGEIT